MRREEQQDHVTYKRTAARPEVCHANPSHCKTKPLTASCATET